MSGAIVIVLLGSMMFAAIPIMIGFYVYRDAANRGMNVVLWTLISILTPLLVGFIIYLLARGSYSDLTCPNCNASIREQYISCPGCGARLKPLCPACTVPVKREWSFCPNCASPLPERYDDVVVPVRKKDKTLGKILVAVVLIPLLLLLLGPGIVFFFSVDSDPTGGTGVTSLAISDYLNEIQNPEIEKWLNECGEYYERAYILRHVDSHTGSRSSSIRVQDTDTSEEVIRIRYLIYVPCLTEDASISVGSSSNLFGRTIKLALSKQDGNSGNTLLLVTYTGKKMPKLKLYYGNKKLDCEITDVEYSLGLTEVLP